MKLTIFACTLLSIAFATNAMASNKICYGSTKSDDTKGLVMSAVIDAQNITLKSVKGQAYDGTYPIVAGTVQGRDGVSYLQYRGEYGDQQDYILVDESLLSEGTSGLLQIRSRGEGFFNSVYVCHDAN